MCIIKQSALKNVKPYEVDFVYKLLFRILLSFFKIMCYNKCFWDDFVLSKTVDMPMEITAWKCIDTELFLVHTFSHYNGRLYPVRIWEKKDQRNFNIRTISTQWMLMKLFKLSINLLTNYNYHNSFSLRTFQFLKASKRNH